MFESLTEKLTETFKKLRGQGRITERNIDDTLKEVRAHFLEADVNYKVTKDFIVAVKARALGAEVMQSLNPGQQFVKIVHQEMVRLLGEEAAPLNLAAAPPAAVMLVGLQGSGKTTTAGKLALYLRKQGRSPYLVPADVQRPAAIDQLKILAGQIQVPVFDTRPEQNPVEICREARQAARVQGLDTMLIDTAGRLHVDAPLMEELKRIKAEAKPVEVLLVADAMTGQDAVTVAEAFHQAVGLTGLILTKLDGDARGGAALSIKSVTGTPIKLVGLGEKLEAIEPFYPERMASRILDMGDILTLIEKAQESFDEKQAREMEKRLRRSEFTLDDFRTALKQMRKMGPLEDLVGMIPGMKAQLRGVKNLAPAEAELKKIEAIICSMTLKERRDPVRVLNGSRRQRIARGSGTAVSDVNHLVRQYQEMCKLMKRMKSGGGMLRALGLGS
ncbi:MAG: signal recognition particle protein [Deltaproteobacteria bacterium RBG_13_61_14]|nr:MAG: signal recognition particle protein [Deltaproteobacteria bacterium RBG_13_61_14]